MSPYVCDCTNVVYMFCVYCIYYYVNKFEVRSLFSTSHLLNVSRQTRKFYAQANMLLRNFRYCSNEVKCSLFKSLCTNMYCCPLWFNSTSSSVKKLKCI